MTSSETAVTQLCAGALDAVFKHRLGTTDSPREHARIVSKQIAVEALFTPARDVLLACQLNEVVEQALHPIQ